MQTIELTDGRIIRVADILEQINSVDKMVGLHAQKDNRQDIMLLQYQYRRSNFLKELTILLNALNIQAADLAA